jgi:ferredoxin
MKVRVAADLCCGAQRCAIVAPEVYTLVDGFNALVGQPDYEVPVELEAIARRGAKACPECAITVED